MDSLKMVCPVPERRVCNKPTRNEGGLSLSRPVDCCSNGEWRNGSNKNRNGEDVEITEWQKAKAGTAKLAEQPAMAVSRSVYSPLKYFDEAIIGGVACGTPVTASSLKHDVRLRWQCLSRCASRSFLQCE